MHCFLQRVYVHQGGGNLRSVVGITCGSFGYWSSTVFMFLWILAISYFVRTKLMASSAAKKVK